MIPPNKYRGGLDPEGGKQDALAGQQQAEDAASSALKAALSIAIEQTAETYGRFTSDHVWQVFRTSHPSLPVPEPRILGPMLLKAFKAGLIRRTDETAPSQRKDRQSGTVAIYESLRAFSIALAPGTPPKPQSQRAHTSIPVFTEISIERARQDAKWGAPRTTTSTLSPTGSTSSRSSSRASPATQARRGLGSSRSRRCPSRPSRAWIDRPGRRRPERPRLSAPGTTRRGVLYQDPPSCI